ncbi:MAG TPA: cyclopropane-fatty-acyl-phospholipid synthase family protein [Stellaceae bacterium]|nr:cyclopropane-fatty-acyl-phospholipid synthase family protein [Stellaceae bacterium]
MLLAHLLRNVVREGTLRVVDAHGKVRSFAGEPGPSITIRLHDAALGYKLFVNPRLYIGEAFMDGTLTVEDASIYEFLNFAAINLNLAPRTALTPFYQGFGTAFRIFQQYNPLRRARANVAHHYDLSDTLYDLFLDADRQYSCAYFLAPEQSIEVAQANKKRHIAAKLLLKPGQSVLDIGCGWGGLALYLARECDVSVTGLTLSEEQLKLARRRAADAGLADRVRFELCDYREATGRYDRIVSVGMFEHVGVVHYPVFFRRVKELLAEDGVALLHSIGRHDGPGATNPWLRKYIFPGGYSPAISEVVPVVERTGLWITDIEILRLHYAETLRAWRQRFNANRERVRALYDERFCRMWEFYLAGSEVAFRQQGHMNFQMQLAKRVDAVPLTRDYITEWERSHRAPEAERVGLARRA